MAFTQKDRWNEAIREAQAAVKYANKGSCDVSLKALLRSEESMGAYFGPKGISHALPRDMARALAAFRRNCIIVKKRRTRGMWHTKQSRSQWYDGYKISRGGRRK